MIKTFFLLLLNKLLKLIVMSVIKVIEIMAQSKKSWEDATAKAIKKASQSVKGIRSAYVQDQSVVVQKGEIVAYRVTLKVSFEVK